MTDYTRFLSPTGRQLTESAIRRMGTVVARTGDMVSFAPGYPDASLFPWQELRDISAGLLVRPFSAAKVNVSRAYWLVQPPDEEPRPAVQTVAQWMRMQAELPP